MDTEKQDLLENGIVVDLGKQSRKKIKQFRRKMKGKLAGAIQETLHGLKTAGKLAENAQPVVFVVREKKSGMRNPFFG
jgi:hypothetical protein